MPEPGSSRRETPFARLGARLADFCERWFPDAFVFALGAVVVVFALGLAVGERPAALAAAFGGSFWSLVPFTMQMALVIIGGFVVASSPPVARVIAGLAGIPKTGRGAVAFTAFFAMATSLLSWGLSLVFTGLLVRELTRRVERLDYRAVSAAAYLGLGSVWAFGLSSSAALLQATRSSIPASLLAVTGVLPLSQTIFLWQSIVSASILIAVSVGVAWFSAPAPERAKTAASYGVSFEAVSPEPPPGAKESRPATPGERLERSRVPVLLVGALMAWAIVLEFRSKGGFAALDLDTFNLIFLTAGLLLHGRPRSFLAAVSASVPATAGVLIQFPFYAGIFGLISKTAIAGALARTFVAVTTRGTFPVVVAAYSALLGLFVPSGGGKWVIEAPYVMAAANAWRVHLGWTVQIYNAAEALPNLVNPFWMLPLMGILRVRARELAGYSVLQLLFHAPIVLFLCWWFAKTIPYLPPVR
jgi:short-chain fatty acids transporter